MNKRLISFVFAATGLPFALGGAAWAQQDCKPVGSAPVALTGMISSLQASGPPGYGQTPREDSVIQVPIIQLNPALCVSGAAGGPGEQTLNSVQLVFPQGGPQFQTQMTGTSFMVSGTLEPAQGPEHLTPVVLMVQHIEQVMAPVDPSAPQPTGAMQPQPGRRGY